MKNLLTFIFLILLLQNIHAQTPQIFYKEKSEIGIPDDFGKKNSEKKITQIKFKDTIQNIILVRKKNIATDGNNFLIDIPIKAEKMPIGFFIEDEKIPLELYFDRKSFLPAQNEFFLFTPDWEFHKEIIEEQKRTGIHIKNAHRRKVYHIKRNNTGYKVDSLIVPDNTNITFRKTETETNAIKFYYSDCYGSVCCTRDDKWDSYEAIQNTIKDFEKQNNLIIPKSSNSFGEEGEHCTSYNLDEFTTEQILSFIKEVKSETREQFPQIYLPSIIE
ncbi:hypothetical protein [Moheibacter sediminis]|uniref:Uncharacterized protein n=1 Tax=Moheibacter sediminis TaxID=1434700 RepID=A0A1W2A8S2_9FLAO|nr:hypothetical protein [Moheibacter sediminis]SMC57046.1 hypothetical protein SAMN06296427_10424 [Moheibacter sediminis]